MAAPVRVGLSAVSGVCDPVPVPLLARCPRVCVPSRLCVPVPVCPVSLGCVIYIGVNRGCGAEGLAVWGGDWVGGFGPVGGLCWESVVLGL